MVYIPKICSEPGCGNEVYGRGLCSRCYSRLRKLGEIPPRSPSNRQIFLQKVLAYKGDECVLVPWSDKKGAVIQYKGKKRNIFRIVCEVTNGPAPGPRHIAAHNCHNGHLGCATPKHLEWQLPEENALGGAVTRVLAALIESGLNSHEAAERVRFLVEERLAVFLSK